MAEDEPAKEKIFEAFNIKGENDTGSRESSDNTTLLLDLITILVNRVLVAEVKECLLRAI